jgi:hypothetical protein
MRVVVIVLLLALLAGCGSKAAVQPCCSGPLFPLNPGTWTPAATDLAS